MLAVDRVPPMKSRPVKHRIRVENTRPATVEIDSVARAAYVRFKKSKVHRTACVPAKGCIITADYDRSGEVVGVEFVGIQEFSIKVLLKKASVDAPKIDLSRTRYVSPGVGRRDVGEIAVA